MLILRPYGNAEAVRISVQIISKHKHQVQDKDLYLSVYIKRKQTVIYPFVPFSLFH